MSKNTTRVAPLLGPGKSKSKQYRVHWGAEGSVIDYGNDRCFSSRKTAVNFAAGKLLKKGDIVLVVVE